MTAQLSSSGTPVTAAPGTLNGYDFASFLLGLPSATNVRFGTPSTYFRSWGYIGYFPDDWRARPNLTLEYGVRYEAFTPPSELCGHFSNLELNQAMSEATVVIPSQTGSCSTALPVSSPRAWCKNSELIHGNYDHWAPRFGFGLAPADQSALRKICHHGARRLRHVLQRIHLQPAHHRAGQSESLGQLSNAGFTAVPAFGHHQHSVFLLLRDEFYDLAPTPTSDRSQLQGWLRAKSGTAQVETNLVPRQ